jgi:glutamate carboxypeptidase
MTNLSALETSVLCHIDQAAMLSQVQLWCGVNSGSFNLKGLTETAHMLVREFAQLPGNAALVQAQPTTRVLNNGDIDEMQHGDHLVVTVRPDAPIQLLFTGHMDTVFPVDHAFQAQKWISDGILNGPGAADMKGGIAVMLAALLAIESETDIPDFGYQVLINSDEEVGSPSSAGLISEMAQGKLAALTYEPALPDGTLAGARGGSGNYSFIITGKSAHAGRNPDDGRNALVAAADMAVRLKALTQEGLSVNPARIDGGGPNNVVPDHAILRVNLRPQNTEIQNKIIQSIASVVSDIERDHDVQIHQHGGFGRPPKPITEGAASLFHLVKQCGADLGLSIGWRDTGGVCDGNNIAACGIPVVDTMGVRGGDIHSANEYLIVDSLKERAQLSALTILRLAAKGSL